MVKLFKLIPLKHFENWMKNKPIHVGESGKNNLKRSAHEIMHSSPVYNSKKRCFDKETVDDSDDEYDYEENVVFDNPVSHEKKTEGGRG